MKMKDDLSSLLASGHRYIEGRETAATVGTLATRIIALKHFEELPGEVQDAVNTLFHVHDGRQVQWHPSNDELVEACATIAGFLAD